MPRTVPLDPALKEQAFALYMQGFTPRTISLQIAVPYMTLNKWVNRGSWKVKRDGTAEIMIKRGVTALARETSAKLSEQSERLREGAANVLQRGMDALEQVKVKATAKSVKELAEALEPLGRTAKLVHGWRNEGPTGMILGEVLASDRELPALPVDVQATVEQVPCVPDTATGSIPPAV